MRFHKKIMQDDQDMGYVEPIDNNILVCSWIDDWGNQQKDFEDKMIFYNSETLLNHQNVMHHFPFPKDDNRALFYDKQIEFCCKKGQQTAVNQDNFFIIVDGETKIYGIFDGHGVNGHRVSGFVMGAMLDYVKNSK